VLHEWRRAPRPPPASGDTGGLSEPLLASWTSSFGEKFVHALPKWFKRFTCIHNSGTALPQLQKEPLLSHPEILKFQDVNRKKIQTTIFL
jgi:hypothetical protein